MKLTKYLEENFRLLKLVHSSDKTKIFLVEEIATCQKFLLKVINRTDLLYSQIAKIKNVTLPKIYHVEESGSATYVVEEYLQGMDLQEYLDLRGALNEKITCRLAIELCDCLQELHKRHIIHRDIKPSNLFLINAGKVKLIDFDAARLEKPGRFADTYFIGTPGFAAPEQYGFHQTDERTDIYSLGLTFKLLLGYENYRGYLSPILAKCIEFDPNKRFDSVRSLKRAIIRRRRFRHWRKFFVAASVGVAILGVNFFPQPAESPAHIEPLPVEVPVAEVQSPVKEISVEPVVYDEPTYYEPTYYEPEPQQTPEPEPTYYEPEPQQTPESEPTKPARQIDYSTAESPEVQERGIPRKILEERGTTAEQADEYYKRLELSARAKEFEASLPDDMSDDEKREATREFRLRTKATLGL